MPTKMRLQRKGKKGRPFYHIVIADGRAPRDGKFIERIGTYNPITKPAEIELKFERALDWLQKGAQPTDTVRSILSYKGVLFKNHLLKGVTKGALTEEQAEAKFQAWLSDKESRALAKISETEEAARTAKKKRFDDEVKVNEARAKALAAKRAKEIEDQVKKTKEEIADETAETAVEVAEAVAETEVVEAVAEVVAEEVEAAAEVVEAAEAKTEKPGKEPVPEKTEEVKEEAKEEPKAEIQEETKEEKTEEPETTVKEEAKEEAKEKTEEPEAIVKEEAKEEAKAEAKEKTEEPEAIVKEESKEDAKEKAVEETKEEVKEEPKAEVKEAVKKEKAKKEDKKEDKKAK